MKNITWKKIIIAAIILGVYTGIVNVIPFLKNTSFSNIAVSVEAWILFALIIVLNCKKPLEAALKCFVFFLISQPIVYLVESPFLGLGVFKYYIRWFIMTLFTFPLAYITWYINKKNVFSLIIVTLISSLLFILGIDYFTKLISNFPHHLLTVIYCFGLGISLPFILLDKKKSFISFILSIILVVCFNLFFTSEYEVSSLYDLGDGNWKCASEDYDFEMTDNIITVKFKDKKDREFYINCTNNEDEMKIKVIYEDGVISFE